MYLGTRQYQDVLVIDMLPILYTLAEFITVSPDNVLRPAALLYEVYSNPEIS